jgi:acetate kinase
MLLVLNSGSSTIKFEAFEPSSMASLGQGVIERIGEAEGRIKTSVGKDRVEKNATIANHARALEIVFDVVEQSPDLAGSDLQAVGHRVVHGGDVFSAPVLIDQAVLQEIRAAIPLAPLHNPGAIAGIEAVSALKPEIPQAAVFDTAFHQTMPPQAFHYAIPKRYHEEHGVRRYGMHGTSHQYVATKGAEFLGRPLDDLNLITLHLGNGASAAAIRGGRCIDTSMGMTPLEGLVMGTRCGDLDPAIMFFLERETALTSSEIEQVFNKESGLKGLCGESDLRKVIALADGGDDAAKLALQIYCYRIRKYIGAYAAALGALDAIIFTAGVGENSSFVRQRVCAGLDWFGIQPDANKNDQRPGGAFSFHADDSKVSLLVVPTDEERAIAEATWRLVQARRAG